MEKNQSVWSIWWFWLDFWIYNSVLGFGRETKNILVCKIVRWRGILYKAMMSHHPRRILTHGESRKRKEREAYYSPRLPAHLLANKPSGSHVAGKKAPTNELLAGYLAFEYLTRGTLLGEKYDPSRAVSTAMLGGSSSSSAEPSLKTKMEKKSYAEVSNVLKSEGVHIPGIVNPTQLARWIKMWRGRARLDWDSTSTL